MQPEARQSGLVASAYIRSDFANAANRLQLMIGIMWMETQETTF